MVSCVTHAQKEPLLENIPIGYNHALANVRLIFYQYGYSLHLSK